MFIEDYPTGRSFFILKAGAFLFQQGRKGAFLFSGLFKTCIFSARKGKYRHKERYLQRFRKRIVSRQKKEKKMKTWISLLTLAKNTVVICAKKAQSRLMTWLIEYFVCQMKNIVFTFATKSKSAYKNSPFTVSFFRLERKPKKTEMQNIGLLRHTDSMSQKPALGGRETTNRFRNLTARACSEPSKARGRQTPHLVPLMVPLV